MYVNYNQKLNKRGYRVILARIIKHKLLLFKKITLLCKYFPCEMPENIIKQ